VGGRGEVADRRAEKLVFLAFSVVVLIGGTNFVAVRFSNRELAPFWGAALRFAAAALLLFAGVLVRRLPLPRGRGLLGAVIYGALGFGAGYAFAYWGLQRVPAGLAAVILASTPLFTFALAVLHRQEQFRWQPLLGGAIALGGILVMFSRSASAAVPLSSLLAMIATAICAAEASIVIKQFPKSHPITTNAIAMATGAVILFALSVAFREPLLRPNQVTTWIALLYLVLLGSSTAFVLFLFVLKHWAASAVAYQFVLFPVVATVAAAWLEHQRVAPSMAFGGLLVLAGVYAGAVAGAPFARTPHRLGSEPCLTCAE